MFDIKIHWRSRDKHKTDSSEKNHSLDNEWIEFSDISVNKSFKSDSQAIPRPTEVWIIWNAIFSMLIRTDHLVIAYSVHIYSVTRRFFLWTVIHPRIWLYMVETKSASAHLLISKECLQQTEIFDDTTYAVFKVNEASVRISE